MRRAFVAQRRARQRESVQTIERHDDDSPIFRKGDFGNAALRVRDVALGGDEGRDPQLRGAQL